MTRLCTDILLFAIVFAAYTYIGYPALLFLLASARKSAGPEPGTEWPPVTIVLPAYNEERVIRATLENLLQLDYPAHQRRILVVSDASTDGTDQIVAEYADRRVDLVRLGTRGGKTAAENAALAEIRTDIVVNTDASVHVERGALKALVAPFADPTVGVVSSHNVSVAHAPRANYAESWYVGYDMWVRGLETRLFGIVGAAGCLYAARASVQRTILPQGLSRDFASALLAREQGFRALSAGDAICYVPRMASLRREYRRKVRTITRGLETLHYKRHLLNPLRYGVFSWILISHKVCRWLIPHVAVIALVALGWLAASVPAARWTLLAATVVSACALIGWWWPDDRALPKVVAVPAFLVMGNVAALVASLRAMTGNRDPIWEPTRRDFVRPPSAVPSGPDIPR